VIYWAWNDLLSVAQPSLIIKKHGAKIELWDNVKEMFGKKATPGACRVRHPGREQSCDANHALMFAQGQRSRPVRLGKVKYPLR